MTLTMKDHTELLKVKIHSVEDRGDFWYFTWTPCRVSRLYCGAFGASRIYKTEELAAEKFFVVRIIDNGASEAPEPHWYPLPGNRGYDLMC